MADTPQPQMQSYVHVRVGTCDIAIPIAQVRQALPQQSLTILPRRTGALLGLLDVAGASVPIVALERWVPIEGSVDVTQQRLLVLQQNSAQVGIQVDAVLGVKAIASDVIRRVHQVPDSNELFESVIPHVANSPTLCILDVARLMQLSQVWCADVGHESVNGYTGLAPVAAVARAAQRYAMFQIGTEFWAVTMDAIQRVIPLPAVELPLGRSDMGWGICQVKGRKLALVDISEGHQTSSAQDAPWMVMLENGPLALGLSITACKEFIEVGEDSIARTPDDVLLAGVAVLPGVGKLQILDVAKLFSRISLAAISLSDAVRPVAVDASGARKAADASAYLVFETDQRYASPVSGIVGLVALPMQARDDLRQGKPTALAWRGRSIAMFNLPSLNTAVDAFEPTLAVLVQAPDGHSPPVGVAIKRVCDWLPAYSAARRGMRMNAMGEFCMINAHGNSDVSNIVVVDLVQIAYLLA